MKKISLLSGFSLVLTIALMAASNTVYAKEKVSIQQVPESVRDTIQHYLGDGKILKIERQTRHGVTFYKTRARVNDQKVVFDVSETGEYLGPHADHSYKKTGKDPAETVVEPQDVPKPVMDAFNKIMPRKKPARIIKEAHNGATVYEAEFEAAGLQSSVKVSQDGNVLEIEKQVAVEDLPPAVAKRAKETAFAGKIKKAEQVTLQFYEIEFGEGKHKSLRLYADGQPVNLQD